MKLSNNISKSKNNIPILDRTIAVLKNEMLTLINITKYYEIIHHTIVCK